MAATELPIHGAGKEFVKGFDVLLIAPKMEPAGEIQLPEGPLL